MNCVGDAGCRFPARDLRGAFGHPGGGCDFREQERVNDREREIKRERRNHATCLAVARKFPSFLPPYQSLRPKVSATFILQASYEKFDTLDGKPSCQSESLKTRLSWNIAILQSTPTHNHYRVVCNGQLISDPGMPYTHTRMQEMHMLPLPGMHAQA